MLFKKKEKKRYFCQNETKKDEELNFKNWVFNDPLNQITELIG